ncbi:hypothetical protein BT96DRAFT_172108 [Gymnopus androsaceus JB14]|uniref:Uncharacterized protein n=1 Tax=Gymnopus androsaceus JB14 TaxID=1447944 RepID=A0A6A4ICZ2_9AGAR|nr:hypothetical protein BT96DRAFT_172108 [Gymnopus androsaceus JB14]
MSSPWRNEHEQDGSWPGIPSIQDLYPDKFDCDDEPQQDFEQCDFPALNLGTESLACTPNAATAWTLGGLRRARSRTISTQAQRRQAASADRDCAICFDLAKRPAKTRCCGKLFCQDHLRDVRSTLLLSLSSLLRQVISGLLDHPIDVHRVALIAIQIPVSYL